MSVRRGGERGDSMTERERIGEGEASEPGPRGRSPASQTIYPHARQGDAPPRCCLRSRGFLR
eukprot:4422255-Prymnesium_polylepis.1